MLKKQPLDLTKFRKKGEAPIKRDTTAEKNPNTVAYARNPRFIRKPTIIG